MKMSLFKNRSLLKIGFSESVSNIGNWITMMAVFAMVVFNGEGTIAQSSGIFMAGLLPTLVASPAAGWLIDRFDRKWLMIGSELISGAVISGLIFTQRIELIYTILALQAVSISLMTPARQAVVPDIVPEEDLTQANAFLQQLFAIVKIGGPVLAGAILAVVSPHVAIIIDVVSFGLSALILGTLPALPPHKEDVPESNQTGQPVKHNLLGVIWKSGSLRVLFLASFFAIFMFIGFDVLSPIFTRDVLLANERFYGFLIGAIGLGAVGGTVLLMVRKVNLNPWLDVTAGMVMLACIPFSMTLATRLGDAHWGRMLVGLGCLVGGFGLGMLNTQVITLIQLSAPPNLLGRLSGAYQSAAVAGQLAGLLVTPLVVPAVLTFGPYFLAMAIATCILVGLIRLSVGSFWHQPLAKPGLSD